jgi:hypothetical protein
MERSKKMSNELAIREGLSVQDIQKNTEGIHELMKQVLKKDVHYGRLPGTSKPILFLPGAQKLGFKFSLIPNYKYETIYLDDNKVHREYIVTCDIIHGPTGVKVGAGAGSCSTMESKYRYRLKKEKIPSNYWELNNQDQLEIKNDREVKKINNIWYFVDHIENQDIADCYNTCLKMAQKRAYVYAMINATATTDIFDHDILDDNDKNTEIQDLKKEIEQLKREKGIDTNGSPDNKKEKEEIEETSTSIKKFVDNTKTGKIPVEKQKLVIKKTKLAANNLEKLLDIKGEAECWYLLSLINENHENYNIIVPEIEKRVRKGQAFSMLIESLKKIVNESKPIDKDIIKNYTTKIEDTVQYLEQGGGKIIESMMEAVKKNDIGALRSILEEAEDRKKMASLPKEISKSNIESMINKIENSPNLNKMDVFIHSGVIDLAEALLKKEDTKALQNLLTDIENNNTSALEKMVISYYENVKVGA